MRLNIFFVLLLAIFNRSNGLQKDFAMPHYSNALTEAILDIIEKFYMNRTNTLNFYHASKEFDDKGMQENLDTMNEILYNIRSKIIVQLEGYSEFNTTNRTRVYNIIFVDSFESFEKIFSLFSPFYFDYQGFYLIALTNYTYQQYQIMTQMFENLWAEFIVNVNVIWLAPENSNEAIMYTYFPYTPFFCGKAFPIKINQFYFGKWLHGHSHFFRDKIANLYGCPLKVATVDTPPFMMLKRDQNNSLLPDGIDGVLLRVLSQRMNFTIDLEQVDSQGSIDVYGNSSGDVNELMMKIKQ